MEVSGAWIQGSFTLQSTMGSDGPEEDPLDRVAMTKNVRASVSHPVIP